MLDRARLAQELSQKKDTLFVDCSEQYKEAKRAFEALINDPLFAYRVKGINAPWPVPLWEGLVNQSIEVPPVNEYVIASVDGSQVYPDRHYGVGCFLVNIGSVVLRYGSSISNSVQFNSVPTVFTGAEGEDLEGESLLETVDGKRQELELAYGLQFDMSQEKNPQLLLFDGSLIFWHLASKTNQLQDHFLPKYLAALRGFEQKAIINASYISMPKSKELVSLIRLQLCNFDLNDTMALKKVDKVLDSWIASLFLEPGYRSTVFKNRSAISEHYPDSVHPYFFYIHVGTEIGRVEIPQWVAKDDEKVTFVASVLLDQCTKGNGYPVALAEAHEQAVVKSADRDFFYHLLNRLGFERNQQLRPSQKLIKKRGIGI